MNVNETTDLLTAMAGMYPNVTISKDTIRGYHMLLADLPAEHVIPAIPRILEDHTTFMPTAPQLRQALMGTPADQSGIPDAAEAWAIVQKDISNRGFMQGGRFKDATIQRTVNAIGWEQICMCELKDQGTQRAQFLKIYSSFRESGIREVTGGNAIRILPTGAGSNKEIAG